MEDSARLKKMTFAIPVSLLERLRDLAHAGRIRSTNAAVREALEKYVVDLEREDFRQAMESAAADPEFLKDIKDVDSEFQSADRETSRMMQEW